MTAPVGGREIAIITGASSGIGAGFAAAFAARGYDLVLVARRRDALEALAATIGANAMSSIRIVAGDLTDDATLDAIDAACGELGGPIGMLVNNAGFGLHAEFAQQDPANARAIIRLNIDALVMMTHRVLPGMLARGAGGIINIASTAAFQPVPYMAVYGATKAFVLSFSEAVAEECRARGVRVLALAPGATDTPFFAVAGESAAAGLGKKRTVANVVATGLRAYDAGRTVAVDGLANAAMTVGERFIPRSLVARMAATMMKR